MKQRPSFAADRLAFTIDEFADACGISRGLFYKMQRSGRGPRVLEMGRRRVILREDGLAWLRSLARPAK
jgi:predicted DNA-binding transcriptional regulator AlpA